MTWETKNLYAFGPFRFDARERLLSREDRPIPLPPKAIELLYVLVENTGHLVEKDDLMKQVWPDTYVEEGNLNKNISILRKTLGQWDGGREYIETVPKRGYRFVATVNEVSELREPSLGAPAPAEVKEIALTARSRKLNLGVLAIAVAVLVFGSVAYRLGHNPSPRLFQVTQLTSDGQQKFGPLLSDGARLYFNTPTPTGWMIGKVSVIGGDTTAMTATGPGFVLKDVSPTGSELLISRVVDAGIGTDQPIFVFPLPSGPPRRLGKVLAHEASWSPDGKSIVYAQGHDLRVAKADGSETRELASLGGYVRSLRWSRDGARLAFSLYDEKTGLSALWEIGADGSRMRPLLPGWTGSTNQCCGYWTPDGKYFVFQSNHNGNWNSWILPETGKVFGLPKREPLALTTGPMAIIGSVFSKDGKRLFAIGESGRGETVRYDNQAHQFVPYLGLSAVHLNFSRNRQWVAYVTYPDRVLWRSRVDGSERLRLSPPTMEALWPKWSPDGQHIAFSGQIPGQQPFRIYTVSFDGTNLQPVSPGARDEIPPSWSPDGNMLLYGNWIDRKNETEGIHLINLRTHEVSQLPGSTNKMWFPLWSPDGRYVVALSVHEHKLLLFEEKTRTWSRLSEFAVGRPCWSSDGKFVYFDSTFKGSAGFYRIRIADHKLERVADLGGLERLTEGGFGSWTGIAPDDSPLALKDISSREIYAFDLQLP